MQGLLACHHVTLDALVASAIRKATECIEVVSKHCLSEVEGVEGCTGILVKSVPQRRAEHCPLKQHILQSERLRTHSVDDDIGGPLAQPALDDCHHARVDTLPFQFRDQTTSRHSVEGARDVRTIKCNPFFQRESEQP